MIYKAGHEKKIEVAMTLLPRAPGFGSKTHHRDRERLAYPGEYFSTGILSCPRSKTARLHSHYQRTVTDLPWGGRRVRLRLFIRKFRCAEPGCPQRIFTERIPSLVEPYARKTVCLHEVLEPG